MNTCNLMPSGHRESSLVAINTQMYSNYKTDKCDNLDGGWCNDNKRWCYICTGCHKKQPDKVEPDPIPKSGHKNIVFRRQSSKWAFAKSIDGRTRILKESYSIDELVEFRDKYYEGVTNG